MNECQYSCGIMDYLSWVPPCSAVPLSAYHHIPPLPEVTGPPGPLPPPPLPTSPARLAPVKM